MANIKYQLFVIFLVVLIFIIIHQIISLALSVSNKKITNKLHKTAFNKNKKIRSEFMFSRYVIIPQYKKEKMEKDLFSLDITMTPEQYVSSYIYASLPSLLVTIGLFALRFNQIAISGVIFSIYIFFNKKDRLKRALNYRQLQIDEESPSLIRFTIDKLKITSNIKAILEDYLPMAGYLERDIRLTITDMSANQLVSHDTYVYALENLDIRLNNQTMKDFISGLINTAHGRNQENFFVLIERDLRTLVIKNLQRKSKKIEAKVRNCMFGLIGSYLFILFPMIIIFIMESMK